MTHQAPDIQNWLNKIHQGNALDLLKRLPDNSVDCCITSPPYFGLRDYGTATWEGGSVECDHAVDSQSAAKKQLKSTLGPNKDGLSVANSYFIGIGETYKKICGKCGAVRIDEQIGLEDDPDQFIDNLTNIFNEVKRVLKPDGTLWLNMGDSYNSVGGGYASDGSRGKNGVISPKTQSAVLKGRRRSSHRGLKPKDLIGIPWMLAFALRNAGWYLRQDIIWHKKNAMPESVTDRCTKAHEYIFLLSKSNKYYYDHEAIKKRLETSSVAILRQNLDFQAGSTRAYKKTNGNMKATGNIDAGTANKRDVWEAEDNYDLWQWLFENAPLEVIEPLWQKYIADKQNKTDVWSVATKALKLEHFAPFPESLITDMIKAGCPEGGVVLDCFGGSGTTGVVAGKLNRNYILFELSKNNVTISNNRLANELGLFQ